MPTPVHVHVQHQTMDDWGLFFFSFFLFSCFANVIFLLDYNTRAPPPPLSWKKRQDSRRTTTTTTFNQYPHINTSTCVYHHHQLQGGRTTNGDSSPQQKIRYDVRCLSVSQLQTPELTYTTSVVVGPYPRQLVKAKQGLHHPHHRSRQHWRWRWTQHHAFSAYYICMLMELYFSNHSKLVNVLQAINMPFC